MRPAAVEQDDRLHHPLDVRARRPRPRHQYQTPLLHVATVGDRTITDVLAWLETDDRKAPVDILRSGGDPAAQSQLEGVLALDARNEDTTYMSAAHLLHAYRYPEVLAASKPGFTPTDLLDEDPHPLPHLVVELPADARRDRLIGRRRRDRPVAPRRPAARSAAARPARRDRQLRPLPAHLADVSAYGIRIATV